MRFGLDMWLAAALACAAVGVSGPTGAAAAVDPVEKRIDELLRKMTIEEKAGQANQSGLSTADKYIVSKTGAGHIVNQQGGGFTAEQCAKLSNELQELATKKTRLGIPVMIGGDCIYDSRSAASVTFPQQISMGSTWNPDLVRGIYRAIGSEMKAVGYARTYAPNVGVARDPRFGRTGECFSEDPFLTSSLAVAAVKGLMGGSLKTGITATLKHYAAYEGTIGGKDSSAMDISERTLREIYLPPFKAAIEAGAGAVMCAYHAVNGIPCASNKWLLTDILKTELGFDGFVVTDYMCMESLFGGQHVAGSLDGAVKMAYEAGVDVHDFDANADFAERLAALVRKGVISEKVLDTAVRRTLRAKFKAGLFDNPFVDPAQASKIVGSPGHLNTALQAARESMVLLRNEGGLLPLKKDIGSVAVIGPNSDHIRNQLGVWTRDVPTEYEGRVITVLEGIKAAVSPQTKVVYAKGCDIVPGFQPLPDGLMTTPGPAGTEDGFKAEYFNNRELAGDPVLVRVDRKIDFDWGDGSPAVEVSPDNFSVRWAARFAPPASGTYRFSLDVDDGVRFFVDGKPVLDAWADHVGVSTAAVDLTAGHPCDIRIEYHETTGGAKVRLGIDSLSLGDAEIAEAVEVARSCDVAVVVVGDSPGLNTEAHDRADLNLTGYQDALVKAVMDTGKPAVVVLVNGRPLTINSIARQAPAILEAWNPGEQGGTAVAEVLFGDYNPGGKLPISFPRSTGQLPVYYNYEPGWHAASFCDGTEGTPLYSFGYGLSYTKFDVSAPRLSSAKMGIGEAVEVSVDVTNIGDRKGDEVVQLYIHDQVASVVRPVKELKGFKRVSLNPGEKKTVVLPLTSDDLAFYNRKMVRVVEPGMIDVMVGTSSTEVKVIALEVVEK